MLRVLSGIVGRRLNRRCLRDDLEMVTKLLGKYMLIEITWKNSGRSAV